MEIRRWHCYLAINCALILPLISAKTFSLNEALAAESKSEKTYASPAVSRGEPISRFSLNKGLSPEPVHKLRKFKSSKHYSNPLSLGKLPSFTSFRTKKLSEIASELKSKRISDLFRPFYKRKRQSKKREVHKNDQINEKYFPLFKNLGLLFDNLLNDSGESYEFTKNKHKTRKNNSDQKRGIVCSCAVKSDTEPGETQPHKKAIVSAKALSISTEPSFASEKSTASATTTDTSVGNIGSFRQNKDVPVLLPRDTSSSRRDDNGYGERSSSAFHGSIERDITRNHGNRKYTTRNRESQFSTEYDEEDTDSYTRNNAGGNESRRGRNRGNSDIPHERIPAYEATSISKTKKANGHFRRHFYELPREDKLKIRRNKTESEEFISKHIRGIRGPLSENKISDITESIQSQEDYEKSLFGVPLNNTNDKRLTDRSGSPTREDQEIRPSDETVVTISDMSNLDLALQMEPKRVDVPSVSIIDGYSVARDKNGQNKLNEKTIRIHV